MRTIIQIDFDLDGVAEAEINFNDFENQLMATYDQNLDMNFQK